MKKLLIFAAFVVLIFIFSFVGTFAQGSSGSQALSNETIECPMSLPAGEVDGETVICGQLEIPEDWDNPSGKSILITYAIVKAKNQAPFTDPIIYFDGGPGATSLEVIGGLISDFSRFRETRDVIFYDQRGIRLSSELFCPSEVAASAPEPEIPEDVDLEEIEQLLANVSLDSDPVQIAEAYALIPNPALAACGAYFEEQGIDLKEYSTQNSVQDAIALMNALDYPSYNLYGISYGSTLAQEVMRYYDESPGGSLPEIRSVVIDGIMPLTADLTYNSTIAQANVVLDVFEACEADDACSSSYPDIRQRAINLLAAVEETPLVIDDSTAITVQDLRNVLLGAVGNRDGALFLPRLIAELESGVTDVYLRLQGGMLPVQSTVTTAATSDPIEGFTEQADMLADQMRTIADEIETLASQSQRLSDALAGGVTLPQLFVDELVGSAEQLGWNDQLRIGSSLATVRSLPPSRDLLSQVVAQMPESEQRFLLGLIGLMDDEGITQVHTLLQDPVYRLDPLNEIHHTVIHCNDRLSAYDIATTFETLRAFDAPQLIDLSQVDFATTPTCEGYGISATPAPAPAFVTNTSGFPVLVSNGLLDKATSIIWGEAAYENLQNARLLSFPQSEHGATLDSECATDLTNAFFTYPDTEPNAACIESLRPVFVSPDEPLPEAEE